MDDQEIQRLEREVDQLERKIEVLIQLISYIRNANVRRENHGVINMEIDEVTEQLGLHRRIY